MSKGFVLELDISCVQLYSTKLDLHNVLLLIGGLVVAAAAAGSAAASFSDIRDFPWRLLRRNVMHSEDDHEEIGLVTTTIDPSIGDRDNITPEFVNIWYFHCVKVMIWKCVDVSEAGPRTEGRSPSHSYHGTAQTGGRHRSLSLSIPHSETDLLWWLWYGVLWKIHLLCKMHS